MKQQNKKIFDKYESSLHTAHYANYVRNLPRFSIEELEKAYFDETGELTHTNYSCGHCVLQTLKKIAKYFYGQSNV